MKKQKLYFLVRSMSASITIISLLMGGVPQVMADDIGVEGFKVKPIFYDDMENIQNQDWIDYPCDNEFPRLWHISQRRSSSGTKAWYYGREKGGTYETGGENQGSIMSKEITLNRVRGLNLSFNHFLDSQDRASVWVWDLLASEKYLVWEGQTTNGSWTKENIDMSRFVGTIVQIEFKFHADDRIEKFHNEGWYIDDVRITGGR
jgi:hypothetical protein